MNEPGEGGGGGGRRGRRGEGGVTAAAQQENGRSFARTRSATAQDRAANGGAGTGAAQTNWQSLNSRKRPSAVYSTTDNGRHVLTNAKPTRAVTQQKPHCCPAAQQFSSCEETECPSGTEAPTPVVAALRKADHERARYRTPIVAASPPQRCCCCRKPVTRTPMPVAPPSQLLVARS